MSKVRQAAVAGMFYPGDPGQLQRDITSYLADADSIEILPKAIIVPHAGYMYSGPIAASAYACLQAARHKIHKVILLGPAHRVPFAGLAAPSSDGFATPLGTIAVDQKAIDKIIHLPQVTRMDMAHEQEHSLEVQLPFLQMILDNFDLVPLVVGDAKSDEVAEVLDLLWGDDETLIVISSDLSHYQDYATAQKMDRSTSLAIEKLQPEHVHYDMACGRNPVNGLLTLAKQKGMHAKTLDLRNSGDTAGTKDRVVGYGAYVFH
ncbi:MAG: AmmeMemoRadiSam system protein B [Gammaproteobacteria bacterium]|nr:AmmeMemoRadiSam system protein B [Gammaproteobacteria bacterium]